MAEIQRTRIKSLYGEAAGLLSQLPLASQSSAVPPSIGQQYNAIIDELNNVAETDYSRHKLTSSDMWDGDSKYYDMTICRTKIGSLVKRLEEEYDFGSSASVPTSPVIVTVNQNQQVTLNVTPVQEIIESTDDEELKSVLEELKQLLQTSKDPEKASSLLTKIQQKSWEVFMKVLPVVLEQLGRHQGH